MSSPVRTRVQENAGQHNRAAYNIADQTLLERDVERVMRGLRRGTWEVEINYPNHRVFDYVAPIPNFTVTKHSLFGSGSISLHIRLDSVKVHSVIRGHELAFVMESDRKSGIFLAAHDALMRGWIQYSQGGGQHSEMAGPQGTTHVKEAVRNLVRGVESDRSAFTVRRA